MFQKHKKHIFTVIMISTIWLFYENQSVEITIRSSEGKELIYTMPRKDKNKLQSFFYNMFILEMGSYPLFGIKPMAMGVYTRPLATSDWRDFISSIMPCNLKVYSGWKTWQKYQHLFPITQFALWEETNAFWIEPHSSVAILLIHKKGFQEMLNANREDFVNVLGKNKLNAEEFLSEIKEKIFLKDTLLLHQGLIGTIFGFGRENSWLFEARVQGAKVPLSYVWEGNKKVYDFMKNRPYKAWVYLGMSSDDFSSFLTYPCFSADLNSVETHQLQKKYIHAREKILNFYQGKDLVETVLTLLINGPPHLLN